MTAVLLLAALLVGIFIGYQISDKDDEMGDVISLKDLPGESVSIPPDGYFSLTWG